MLNVTISKISDSNSYNLALMTMAPLLQAKNRMTKSSVVDLKTGGSVDSDVRTSTGTFFSRGEDEVGACLGGLAQGLARA